MGMFLEQPVPESLLGPIGGEARRFGLVEDLDALLYLADDEGFRFIEDLV